MVPRNSHSLRARDVETSYCFHSCRGGLADALLPARDAVASEAYTEGGPRLTARPATALVGP